MSLDLVKILLKIYWKHLLYRQLMCLYWTLNVLLDPYVVAWKRGIAILTAGSVKVTPDPRVRLVNGFNLQIRDAVPQDAGDYICQIATMEPREITHTVEILGKNKKVNFLEKKIPKKSKRDSPESFKDSYLLRDFFFIRQYYELKKNYYFHFLILFKFSKLIPS